jgi:hypothetical protein
LTLDWVAGEGFGDTFRRLGMDDPQYSSARAYRERNLTAMVRALIESVIIHRH